MQEVKVAQAKAQLSALLDRVEGGEEIVIARRGKRIARLIPEPRRAATAAAALRPVWALGGLDLDAIGDLPPDSAPSQSTESLSRVRWLLDTNIVIAISKGVPSLLPWLQRCAASDIVLSSVVLAEIEYGIAKSARQAHNRKVFDALVARFEVLAFDRQAAREYGNLRAALERSGRLIGPNDLLIAAHARALRLTLVTDNTGEFTRVDGLAVENWLAQPPA